MLKSRIASIAIIVLIALIAASTAYAQGGRGDWWMEGHDAQHTGRSSFVGPVWPTEKWAFGSENEDGFFCVVMDLAGTIYAGSPHKLCAVNPDGSKKWELALDGYAKPAIGSDGTVYASTGYGQLYAISPRGQTLWTFTAGDVGLTSPTIASDNTIYLGATNNTLYAINPDGSKKWGFAIEGGVLATAIGPDETIYATANEKLCAVNPNGSKKWVFIAGGWIETPPSVGSNGTIYFLASDEKLYALNPDGSKKWEFLTGGQLLSSPVIGPDGTIYLMTRFMLYAIDPQGTKIWEYHISSEGGAAIVDAEGTVYVGSGYVLYAVGHDGSHKWAYGTSEHVCSLPIIGPNGTIYFGSTGKLYAIGTDTSTKPPSIVIDGPVSSDWRYHTYTVTYHNASDITLEPNDTIINKTGTASATILFTRMSGTTFTVEVRDVTGKGTIGISLPAGTAANAAGYAPAAGPSATFAAINSPPGISISAPSSRVSTTGSVSFTVNYTKAASVSLAWKHLRLNNTGTARAQMEVTGTGIMKRKVRLYNIRGQGTLGLSVSAGSARNAIGIAPAAGPSATCAVCGKR